MIIIIIITITEAFGGSFGRFNKLKYLDLRNNSIERIPKTISNLLLWGELEDLTISNNPFCTNGGCNSVNSQCTESMAKALNKKGRGCSKQCSDYCNIMLRESDFHCNYQCNVSACDYDNAQCLV